MEGFKWIVKHVHMHGCSFQGYGPLCMKRALIKLVLKLYLCILRYEKFTAEPEQCEKFSQTKDA